MLGFGMYYVVSNIYRQSVSRYIYYRQSKAYRRIKQARTFFLYGCVGFLVPPRSLRRKRWLVMATIVIFFVTFAMSLLEMAE